MALCRHSHVDKSTILQSAIALTCLGVIASKGLHFGEEEKGQNVIDHCCRADELANRCCELSNLTK